MRTLMVSFACMLTMASAFIPLDPAWRNVGAVPHHVRKTLGSCNVCRRPHMPRVPPLSMGFDFGKMVEKMTDTRYARVRHILIEEKGEEAQARLEGVKNEIARDVDKFSEFAEQMSTCTSAKNGGRLKLLARGETVPEFDEVAFTEQPGNVYGPIETVYGTHLIFLESCNKPENTWKMMFDDIVKKAKGEE